jgi:hypothetical protein
VWLPILKQKILVIGGNSASYTLSWEPDSSLKVVCSNAGPGYAAFGMKLPQP